VAPLLPAVADALTTWRTAAPDNPWGLVWPEPNGRPRNDKHDRSEWWTLQNTAGVAHPSGRPYHVHECRSFAATMLFEAEVPEHVITDLLGHSSIVTSNRYRTVRREPMREAMEKVGRRLQLGG
jgi:integrase